MSEPIHIFEKPTKSEENKLHRIFMWSIGLKGVNALVECLVGFSLFFINTNEIMRVTTFLTQGELLENPDSVVANYILNTANNFAVSSHTFLIYYLLIHGAIKVFLIGGLLLDKKWAYPFAIVVLALFAAYQMFQYFYTPGLWLLALTMFDLFILALIYNEYRYGRKIRGVL
ncbi:MAG: DUF2127 domain-containing protein [bacterium]